MRKQIITMIFFIGITIGSYLLGIMQHRVVIKEEPTTAIVSSYIDTNTDEFINNFVDMREVTGFKVNSNNLYLYLENGEKYYLELDRKENN